ncbi:hypothetical protein BH10ACI1_BH10ACI1_10620 [soil metagenome]
MKKIISIFVIAWILLIVVSVDLFGQTKTKRPQVAQNRKIVCAENDQDCFIQAAETCRKANITLTYSGIMLRIFQTSSTTYEEIRGGRNGKCTFYFRYEKTDLRFTREYVEKLKERGETQEQIEEKERESRESMKSTEGKYGICTFKTERLVELLKKWKTGASSYPDDWQGGNCRGTIFD